MDSTSNWPGPVELASPRNWCLCACFFPKSTMWNSFFVCVDFVEFVEYVLALCFEGFWHPQLAIYNSRGRFYKNATQKFENAKCGFCEFYRAGTLVCPLTGSGQFKIHIFGEGGPHFSMPWRRLCDGGNTHAQTKGLTSLRSARSARRSKVGDLAEERA